MFGTNINNLTKVTLNHLPEGKESADGYRACYVIDDYLVPSGFMTRLAHNLRTTRLNFGDVHDPAAMCKKEFLDSLTENEIMVLPACLLLLMRDRYIFLDF